MPLSDTDPRVFFAAERTLLAWLRTGLTIIALGFVVSRFGLFVQLIVMQGGAGAHGTTPHAHDAISAALGVAFVVLGALSIAIAAIQHARFISTLPLADLPPRYSRAFAIALSSAVAVIGLALAAYLLATFP